MLVWRMWQRRCIRETCLNETKNEIDSAGRLIRTGVLPHDYDLEAHKSLGSMQRGDMPTTYADASVLERDFGFVPKITLCEGLLRFTDRLYIRLI